MSRMDDELLDEFVEEHLRFLRGKGPAPDLSNLSQNEAEEVRKAFEVVGALADSLPESPPIEEDPVAIRLGLVESDLTTIGAGDAPVAVAVRELVYQFPDSVTVEPVEASDQYGDHPLVPRFVCRSLAETVMVLTYTGGDSERPGIAEAHWWLLREDDLTAVALTSEDAQTATMIAFPDCSRRLHPSTGWRDSDSRDLRWEPLELALGRYLQQSISRWGAVSDLPTLGGLMDVAADVRAMVAELRLSLRSARLKLEHKRLARDFVVDLPDELFDGWVNQLRTSAITGDEIAEEIQQRARRATP